MRDWVAWHAAYEDPESPLSKRLSVVRGHLAGALDASPPGPVRLVSLCAGQGHDVLGVLPGHPRGPQVSAVLVEADPQNAALARQGAEQAGLPQVEVRQADAAQVANYADALPADVLLLCGIFGNVSDADIEDAARRANAHEFIEKLPEGYDTLIGERGFKLSGGQRQRLSIARAILADPRILILDEATSNLDTESEQLIQSSLAQLFKNRLTFVIAHRLSTVTHADVIVAMNHGRIVEVGTHAQLMAKQGFYADMVERQWRSFAALDEAVEVTSP